ncbi:hypothetical protein FB567DRAFT_518651 [Paraphoma chrysanthemicola]|uniref:Pentatricopeptide repeat domain-containing protein n=1 Tax=Paraphoma chrysanthemicola TaxID=798071 RepID=A0A8K0RFD0_9PLEO|nr:hypothetical protein FB567DRAFT_518651 [Paraphoma chrysanthemicola]
MPPALDRLLARPSALRLLRVLANAPILPAACSTTTICCHKASPRRNYAIQNSRPKQKWMRWRESADLSSRERPSRRHQREVEETSNALLDSLEGGSEADAIARWAQSLALRERHHGARGVRAIWDLRRHSRFYLPAHRSDDAEYLWATFVRHADLVPQVIDHAAELLKETGDTYAGLYMLVMRYWLPRDVNKALEYHDLMLAKLSLKKLPLKRLAKYGWRVFKPAAYEALFEIYRLSNERNLYDDVVPPLIKKGHISLARRWHNLCLYRDDMPSESVANDPVVHILLAESSNASNPDATGDKPIREHRKYDQELLRRLMGPDIAPVRFEDSFCARMFATRTFPPESVIKGLALVGVNEIGPQAVLAMALGTKPLEDLPMMFEELRAAGIALHGCVFSLAVEKFAREHKWTLLRSILNSDQHPDVFGDADVQWKLLDYYMDQNDDIQIQRTLAILTLFHKESAQESWNLLLQAHIRRTGPQHVTEVLQDMRSQGVMVTIESVNAIKGLLRPRQQGHKPTTMRDGYDDLRFVTRIFTIILEFGMGPVSPVIWREVIRRFGMTVRFRELRRLLLWLLCWYAPRGSRNPQFSALPISPFREPAFAKLRTAYHEGSHYFRFSDKITQHETKLHPIRLLFPPSVQQGLIAWGFRAGLLPNATYEQSLFGPTLQKKHYRQRLLQRKIMQRQRWSIGLRTLVLLRDLGVYIHRHTVIKALQMQFVVLFGHGRSNIRQNRTMERANTIPYATYVREVNEIWGSKLFTEPQRFNHSMFEKHLWHPRMRRQINRKKFISIHDILQPGWQNWDRGSEGRDGRSPNEDAPLIVLKHAFAAQEQSSQPGVEWMHEASLDTTGAEWSSDGLMAEKKGVVASK